MRKVYFLSLLLIWSVAASAQNFPISNGSINTCDGIFTDSGENASYGANENLTYTICPGTQGGNIRLSFTEADFRPGDVLCFYDGTSTNEPMIACSNQFTTEHFDIQATNQTGCLTAVFVSNAFQQADGWKADISCSPNCQEIKAKLISSVPSLQNNYLDICVGTDVELNASALFPNNNQNYHQSISDCSFKWDFGNGQSAQGQNITYNFPQGGGNTVSLTVTDQFGCKSANSINLNMRIAEKPTFSFASNTIPDVCANKILNLSASANDSDANITIYQPGGALSTTKSQSDSLALPDGTGASYVSEIFYNEFNTGQKLENAVDLKNIFVNIEHSWLRDIEITIECPNGQTAMLVHHPGNTGGEVFLGEPNELDEGLSTPVPGIGYQYQWSSDAPNPNWIEYINNNPATKTLPAGNYKPYENFDQLVGCPLNGNWKLDVIDSWASDNGFIFAWGLELAEELYPLGETYKPVIEDIQWIDNKLVTANNGNSIDLLSNTAGLKDFQVQVTNDFGCVVDTQMTINVLPATSPLCYDCTSFKTALKDTSICLGQSIEYDASFDKSQIKTLGYESFQKTIIEGLSFSKPVTVTNVKPGQIGSVNYRIESIDFSIASTQPTNFEVYIESPSGQKMLIGSTINIANTQDLNFSPNANTSINNASAPFNGSYQPQGNWSELQGSNINGDWKLSIKANNNSKPTLLSWGISFKNDVSVGYHWTGNGLSCTNCPTPTVTPTQSGQFIVEVYDNMNCAYSDTVNVSIIQALSPPHINEPTTENGQIIFTWESVENASGYLVKINNTNWITPNGALSQTLDGYVLGDEINFSVKALAAGGCDGSDANLQLKITDCLLTSTHSVVQAPACAGINTGEILVTATNGTPTINYSLNGGLTNSTGIFDNLAVGNHFVIVSDAAGCHDTLVFTLDPNKQLELNITTADVSCFGANDGTAMANITGGAAMPISYSWQTSPIQNTQTISSLSPTTYSVVAIDADGCQLAQTATINSPNELTANFKNVSNVSCVGLTDATLSAQAAGGSMPYSYAWSSGQTTETITNMATGNYSVTITDANNCTATNSIIITEPNSALNLTANQTTRSCAHTNNNVALAIATGGSAPYAFIWSDNQNNATANNLTPGNYSVTVTDNNGCETSTTLSVSEYDIVEVTLDYTEPTCHNGDDGTITVTSITGGNSSNLADYSYQWLGQSDTDEKIENLTGDRSYYLTVTGTSGCKGVSNLLLAQPDPIELDLESTPVTCAGDKNGTAKVLSITGNVGPYNVLWDSNAHNATTEEVDNLSGNLYTVIATNALGCTGSNTIQVKEAPVFSTTSLDSTDPACAEDSNGHATIEVTGGALPYLYEWSNGSLENNMQNITSGTYTVTATDAHNCKIEKTVTLTEPIPMGGSSYAIAPNCFSENTGSITVNATGGTGTYVYSLNNNTYTSENTLKDVSAGLYPIYIKDENDCIYVDTVTVMQPPEFTLDAGPDLKLSYGEPVEIPIDINNANGGINVMVVNPLGENTTCNECYEIIINPKYHGEHVIIATDENGCMATDYLNVFVDKNLKFLVPTAFTPNNDEKNDFLTCHTKNEAKVNYFRVYDRWGSLIFESLSGVSNQPKQGWDGTSKGEKMPAGTYIWTASVLFDNGVHEVFKGQTTLIR